MHARDTILNQFTQNPSLFPYLLLLQTSNEQIFLRKKGSRSFMILSDLAKILILLKKIKISSLPKSGLIERIYFEIGKKNPKIFFRKYLIFYVNFFYK